ncbi:MAG: AAA family ATPase [Gemmataceae bacterium]
MTSDGILPESTDQGTGSISEWGRIKTFAFGSRSAVEAAWRVLPPEWGREWSELVAEFEDGLCGQRRMWAVRLPSGPDGPDDDPLGIDGNISVEHADLPRYDEDEPDIVSFHKAVGQLRLLTADRVEQLRAALVAAEVRPLCIGLCGHSALSRVAEMIKRSGGADLYGTGDDLRQFKHRGQPWVFVGAVGGDALDVANRNTGVSRVHGVLGFPPDDRAVPRNLPTLTEMQVRHLLGFLNGHYPIGFGSGAAAAADPNAGICWLWDRMIADKTLAMLSGQPSAGKTTLLREGLLRSLAARTPFLGRSFLIGGWWSGPHFGPPDSARVMVVTDEGEHNWAGRKPLGVTIWDRGAEPAVRLKEKGAWQRFVKNLGGYASDYDLRLIVLDTLGGIVEFNEDDPRQCARVMEPLRELAENVTVLVIHHLPKTATGEHVGGNARGSTALSARADTRLELYQPFPEPDTRRRLAYSNRRLSRKGEIVYALADDGSFVLADKADRPSLPLVESAADIKRPPAAGLGLDLSAVGRAAIGRVGR